MGLGYQLIVLLCSFVNTLALYKFYNYIFSGNVYFKRVEVFSYLLYWVLNNLVYFFINIPFVNLIFNILSFFILTLNYKSHWKKRLFSVIFFYVAMTFIEGFVVFITSKTSIEFFYQNSYNMIVGQIFITIFVYTFTEILIRRKNITREVRLPIAFLIGLLVTPVCSFIIINYILSLHNSSLMGMSLCCLLVLLINLAVFYLYDKIIAHVAQQKEHEQLLQQNRNYLYMIDNMKVSVENTRQLKHDLKNHAIALSSLADAEKYAELKDYLQNIFQDVSGVYVDTGNTTIDSILNFKMQECKNKNIEFEPIVAIPNEMQVPNDILTVVLGNLLDNAIEATNKMKEKRVIRMRIFFEVGMLYIDIANPYDGTLKMKNGEYLTTKEDTTYHGYGLKNIQKAVDRNGGLLSVEANGHLFIVNVILNTH